MVRGGLGACLALAAAACGGTSGGAPSLAIPTGDVPIIMGAGTHPALGLVSVVPAEDSLRATWRSPNLPAGAPSAALFVGTDASTLLGGTPIPISVADDSTTVTGLSPDTTYFTRLAWDDGTGGWDAAGPVLRGRTAAPIYVQSRADPSMADGQSPATAWTTIEAGVAAAAAAGGGNLWASGDFVTEEITVPPDVDLYGGFDPTFDLESRDPTTSPTGIRGASTSSVLTLAPSATSVAVVDGFRIDGEGLSEACFEVNQRSAELRSLAGGRSARGFKLRSASSGAPFDVAMVRCSASACIAGGTSISGPFDLLMEDCAMLGNGQEGLTADPLNGTPGETSRLVARDCVFSHNGAEGLDVDLATSGGSSAGDWVIRLEDCDFSDNRLDGCLIDLDYEGLVGWSARIEIDGCEARRNRQAGFHLDVDAQATSHFHRVTAAANGTEGILISSETAPGTVVVDTSALIGNGTYGARTEMGNVGILLTHCVVSGNRLGAVSRGVAPILATSSIAYLQPSPFGPGVGHESVVTEQTQPPQFEQAPSAWFTITGLSGGTATLSSQPTFGVGATVELNDDGTPRIVESTSANSATVTPPPANSQAPGILSWLASGDAAEDWNLTASSPALGAGMSLQGGPTRDAGPFGAAVTGQPGRLDLIPAPTFRFSETAPTWTQTIGANEAILVRFEGGTLDPSTAMAAIDAVDASGAAVPVDIITAGSVVIVTPAGTWAAGTRLQLHDELRATDGRALCASVAIPIRSGP